MNMVNINIAFYPPKAKNNKKECDKDCLPLNKDLSCETSKHTAQAQSHSRLLKRISSFSTKNNTTSNSRFSTISRSPINKDTQNYSNKNEVTYYDQANLPIYVKLYTILYDLEINKTKIDRILFLTNAKTLSEASRYLFTEQHKYCHKFTTRQFIAYKPKSHCKLCKLQSQKAMPPNNASSLFSQISQASIDMCQPTFYSRKTLIMQIDEGINRAKYGTNYVGASDGRNITEPAILITPNENCIKRVLIAELNTPKMRFPFKDIYPITYIPPENENCLCCHQPIEMHSPDYNIGSFYYYSMHNFQSGKPSKINREDVYNSQRESMKKYLSNLPSVHEECPICREYITSETKFILRCSHSFCKACLTKYIETKINSYYPLAFHCPDCGHGISRDELCSFLSPKILNKINILSQESSVTYCPWCGKSSNITSNSLLCRGCGHDFCTKCKSIAHPDSSCNMV